jgi:hypothetical protein
MKAAHDPEADRPFEIAGALLLFAQLALHALDKFGDGKLPEMLWTCHVTSGMVALGLAARHRGMVVVGGLFHAAVGLPSYVLDVVAGGTTTWVSAALHGVTPALGVWQMRRSGIPRASPWIAAGLWVVMMGVARLLTPAVLNVNLAFAPYAGLDLPLSTWESHAVNIAATLGLLLGAHSVLARTLRRTPDVHSP